MATYKYRDHELIMTRADMEKIKAFSENKINVFVKDGKAYAQIRITVNGCALSYSVAKILMDIHDDQTKAVIFHDGNPLNMMRSNMSVVDANRRNYARKKGAGEQSKYKGVRKSLGKFVAQIHVQGETHYLGTFDDELAAAKEYNKAAKKMLTKHAVNKLK